MMFRMRRGEGGKGGAESGSSDEGGGGGKRGREGARGREVTKLSTVRGRVRARERKQAEQGHDNKKQEMCLRHDVLP